MIPWNDTELKWTAGRKKMQKMDRLEKKRDFKSKREGKIKCLRRGWLVAKSVVRTLKPVIYLFPNKEKTKYCYFRPEVTRKGTLNMSTCIHASV